MGEAKRRKELGIAPRKNLNFNQKTDRYITWLPLTKMQMSRYPYIAPVTMALGIFFLLIDWSPIK